MLNSIRTLCDIPASDEPLVSAVDIHANRQCRLLLDEAQRRAKACVREAEAQAKAIRAHALQQGYTEGVLRAAHDIGDLLVRSQTLTHRLHEQVTTKVTALLGDLLMDRRTLESLIRRWYERHQSKQHGGLELYLPMPLKLHHARIRKSLKAAGTEEVVVHYHAAQRYMFRLGDQVVELDIPDAQKRLTGQLLAQLEELPAAVRTLDESARECLAHLFDELLGIGTVQDKHSDEVVTHAD
ncbi:hypothetical protein PS865_04449 [Pseudomonas fluorescens]|uniref:hypothetical protein n=1 Tax=Pseudomonas fluorescens TaxID=294 RepID=UPI001241D0BF|nr:hypothetical protein [Pseudomonas fluorescens]VVP32768.1 hypothetical protein PS865_04449 [Pseudomonas fluorescens]